jgi:hypothetical protein
MSSTESPVTQIAETAIKSASTSDAPLPDTYENGQTKSDVPTTTRKMKYVNNLPFALFILKLMILTENARISAFAAQAQSIASIIQRITTFLKSGKNSKILGVFAVTKKKTPGGRCLTTGQEGVF